MNSYRIWHSTEGFADYIIDKTILIHCAYNWRVSCFVYLYRVLENNITDEWAKNDMLKVWEPDKTWQSFIDGHLPKQDKDT